MFLTIDGPNGVGKTSVATELARLLQARGLTVLTTREPSDSDLGRFIRCTEGELRGMALATLVVADRYAHVRREIGPALNTGTTVICDRYTASTLVLQRIDGLAIETLWEMNADVRIPDLSVVLTARPDTILERLAARGRVSRFDRMEGIAAIETIYFRDAVDFLSKVGYRTMVVDTEHRSIVNVAREIESALMSAGSGEPGTSR